MAICGKNGTKCKNGMNSRGIYAGVNDPDSYLRKQDDLIETINLHAME
jgi:hypothetical protein